MKRPVSPEVIAAICFGIAALCAVVLFPLSAHIISLPQSEMGTESVKAQWLLACGLGLIGLISVITGQRLTNKDDRS